MSLPDLPHPSYAFTPQVLQRGEDFVRMNAAANDNKAAPGQLDDEAPSGGITGSLAARGWSWRALRMSWRHRFGTKPSRYRVPGGMRIELAPVGLDDASASKEDTGIETRERQRMRGGVVDILAVTASANPTRATIGCATRIRASRRPSPSAGTTSLACTTSTSAACTTPAWSEGRNDGPLRQAAWSRHLRRRDGRSGD